MNDLSFDGYGGDPDHMFGNSGGMEIVGNAGLQEIIGRAMQIVGAGASSTAVTQGPAFAAAVANHLQRVRPIMQHTQITKKRVWPIAFGPQVLQSEQLGKMLAGLPILVYCF